MDESANKSHFFELSPLIPDILAKKSPLLAIGRAFDDLTKRLQSMASQGFFHVGWFATFAAALSVWGCFF